MNELELEKKYSDANPLVTFALFAYNQEKYIREAVEGALAQTYSPLQIILSDDYSPDNTFEIMEKLVAEYSGPHNILLNRNRKNIGLASHINHVMSLAMGELIVVAAGDDVSLPLRTSEIVDFYIENAKPDSIFSDFFDIDTSSDEIVSLESPPHEQTHLEFINSPAVKGAAHAWTKRIFIKFGPLDETVMCEDQVIPFRAYLIGAPRFIDKKLIKYRRYSAGTTKTDHFRRKYRRNISSRNQYINDLQKIVKSESILKIEKQLHEEKKCYEALLAFWNSDSLFGMSEVARLISIIGLVSALREIYRKLNFS